MGRLTQAFHYMNENPDKLPLQVNRTWNSFYTKISITEDLKYLRRKKKWYKPEPPKTK